MIMMLSNTEWLIILRSIARTTTDVLFLLTRKAHYLDLTAPIFTRKAVWIC